MAVLVAWILGLATHSTYLHAKARYGWAFPWDHGCKYVRVCGLYDAASVTCNRDTGGPYCGRWRTLEAAA